MTNKYFNKFILIREFLMKSQMEETSPATKVHLWSAVPRHCELQPCSTKPTLLTKAELIPSITVFMWSLLIYKGHGSSLQSRNYNKNYMHINFLWSINYAVKYKLAHNHMLWITCNETTHNDTRCPSSLEWRLPQHSNLCFRQYSSYFIAPLTP